VPVAPKSAFLHARALAFEPSVVPSTPELKLARASEFLGVMRAGVEAKQGGASITYDVPTTAMNYYSMLEGAKALAAHAPFRAPVKAFLTEDKVPTDLRSIIESAVGVASVAESMPEATSASKVADLPAAMRTVRVNVSPYRFELREVTMDLQGQATLPPTSRGASPTVIDWRKNFANMPSAVKELETFHRHLVDYAELAAKPVTATKVSELPLRLRQADVQLSPQATTKIELLGDGRAKWVDRPGPAFRISSLPPAVQAGVEAQVAFLEQRLQVGAIESVGPVRGRPGALFKTTTAPLSTDSHLSPAEWEVSTNPNFFSRFATDANLSTKPKLGGWDLSSLLPMTEGRGGSVSHAELVRFQARRAELADSSQPEVAARFEVGRQALRGDIGSQWRGDDVIEPLVRYANALGVPAHEVPLGAETLADRARSLGLVEVARGAPVDLDAMLSTFLKGGSQRQKVEALTTIQNRDANSAGFGQLVERIQSQRANGAWAPLAWSALSPTEQTSVLKAIQTDRHPGAAAVLMGVFVSGHDGAALEAGLKAEGFDQPVAKKWSSVAARLSGLNAKAQAFALGEVGLNTAAAFDRLPERVALAAVSTMTQAELAEAFRRWPEGRDRITAFIGWGADKSTAQRQTLQRFFEGALDEGLVTEADVRRSMVDSPSASQWADAQTAIREAAQRIRQPGLESRAGAGEALLSVLRRQSIFFSPEVLVDEALSGLYLRDLQQVMPLGEADRQLGGVPAKNWVDARTPLERLGSSAAQGSVKPTVDALFAKYPRLSFDLEMVRNRLVLRGAADRSLDLVAAAHRDIVAVLEKLLPGSEFQALDAGVIHALVATVGAR
jgi:hypothetical protein